MICPECGRKMDVMFENKKITIWECQICGILERESDLEGTGFLIIETPHLNGNSKHE